MNARYKISLTLFFLMFAMFIGMLINLANSSRSYGLASVENKAKAVAQTVKHGLTAHMLNGTMNNRDFFLNQIKNLSDVNEIWLVRSDSVIEQYGKGLVGETPKDDIDRDVLRMGIVKKDISEHMFGQSRFRITIPYVVEKDPRIDCTSCHEAKVGDTLGAISMVLEIDDLKEEGIKNTLISGSIGFILILIALFFVNHIIKPYIRIFDSIKNVMKFAHTGDYSCRVDKGYDRDTQDVSMRVNSLLEKLNCTLDDIGANIDEFLRHYENEEDKDPLINVKNTVNRLADIYKFKRTIELDADIDGVYRRLASVLHDKYEILHFNFLEVDTTNKTVNFVYEQGNIKCSAAQNGCRADITNSLVDSYQFKDLCERRFEKDSSYLCVPYSISNDLDFIVNIETRDKEEHERIRSIMPLIKDYIETAKPEIVSKKLMEILERSARTDGLTGLYNRKFLEENIPSIISQSKRMNITYGILMCDIDYFKMINDTYGHDVGDEAIKVIADTLKENTRESDYVIRYGGEEFIVLLYNCDKSFVEDIAQKIRMAFSKKKIKAGTESFSKTVSIGVSMYPTHNDSFWKCIKFADVALYEAKQRGRNRVVLFEEKLLENKDLDEDY